MKIEPRNGMVVLKELDTDNMLFVSGKIYDSVVYEIISIGPDVNRRFDGEEDADRRQLAIGDRVIATWADEDRVVITDEFLMVDCYNIVGFLAPS